MTFFQVPFCSFSHSGLSLFQSLYCLFLSHLWGCDSWLFLWVLAALGFSPQLFCVCRYSCPLSDSCSFQHGAHFPFVLLFFCAKLRTLFSPEILCSNCSILKRCSRNKNSPRFGSVVHIQRDADRKDGAIFREKGDKRKVVCERGR